MTRQSEEETREEELEGRRQKLEGMYEEAQKLKQEAHDAKDRVRREEASLKRRSLDMDRTIKIFLNKQVTTLFRQGTSSIKLMLLYFIQLHYTSILYLYCIQMNISFD